MAELKPGDVRVYMKHCFDLARAIDPIAWSPDSSRVAWRRRIISVWHARHRLEVETSQERPTPSAGR